MIETWSWTYYLLQVCLPNYGIYIVSYMLLVEPLDWLLLHLEMELAKTNSAMSFKSHVHLLFFTPTPLHFDQLQMHRMAALTFFMLTTNKVFYESHDDTHVNKKIYGWVACREAKKCPVPSSSSLLYQALKPRFFLLLSGITIILPVYVLFNNLLDNIMSC